MLDWDGDSHLFFTHHLILSGVWKEIGIGISQPIKSTPSMPNCKSFDFFYLKFDHSSYSKNLCKYSQI